MRDINNLVKQLQQDLISHSDEKIKLSSQHYFKEPIEVYGVSSTQIKDLMASYRQQIKQLSKEQVFLLCEELFKSNIFEPQVIACQWSDLFHEDLVAADIETFAHWIDQYVSNWAVCDTLCNHTVGSFIELFPEKITVLKEWTSSTNRWFKRAAAVTLIIPARNGLFLKDIFEIADKLLLDKDDMVQKGYGWMLKAASQAHQAEVFDYVMKHKAVMPCTALRYAIEKMPTDLKKRAMAK